MTKPAKSRKTVPGYVLARELTALSSAWLRHAYLKLPLRLGRSLAGDAGLDTVFDEARLMDIVGDVLLELFNDWGPLYGKAGQVALSRLSPKWQAMAEYLRLNRLYGDWPPMSFEQVSFILDSEIPKWRSALRVESQPLGVASMAQVHAAIDADGREWVIKILKPQAQQRLEESLQAIEQLVAAIKPMAVTAVAKRLMREMDDVVVALRREMSMQQELNTIERVREKWLEQDSSILRIPSVNREFSTDRVLVIERFHGIRLKDVVSKKVTLSDKQRQRLAKQILQELLIQVFEIGLFHADPHAGNLILLEDGSVGLFDWGLAGELREADRHHIAAMLKAVMARDLDRLVQALTNMAAEANKTVDQEKIRRELKRVVALFKREHEFVAGKPKKPLSLQQLIEACLRSADRLQIPVPTGLLLMAKSLMTIEGLARGIDPDVSITRVATPVLWRAAKPGIGEVFSLAKQIPSMAVQWFKK